MHVTWTASGLRQQDTSDADATRSERGLNWHGGYCTRCQPRILLSNPLRSKECCCDMAKLNA